MTTKGLKRDTIDKFYTKESVVNTCIDLIKNKLNINQSDFIIEPSAGNGSFVNAIKTLTNNYLFYDLKPENEEIIEQDYLELDYKDIVDVYNRIHIIGNPPFGRQSSMAFKFIKKSSEFCNSISFILPKSFKKDSFKSKIPINFHLILEQDLPDKSFLLDGKEYDVPCVFQIWEKRDVKRELSKKLEPINFKFVTKDENPDISFRRVGVNAGFIDTCIDKSVQSHYFIKFTNNKPLETNLQALSSIKFEFNNTVGPKSISKQELIHKFNDKL